MSTPESSPVVRLRRLAEALAAGLPPDGEDARLVGERLLAGLDGDGLQVLANEQIIRAAMGGRHRAW
jgi:hypothetical protein